MCGIVGYVGSKDCAPILVEGLRRLEYRGYDSAGLAVHTGRGVEIVRAVGKLANLDAALQKQPLRGTTGIGHTRWATHGRPSEANAHPHAAGDVAVVHNGIIENHVALRRDLEARGVRFSSDTDTEIVAHLIDLELRAGAAAGKPAILVDAVRATLTQLRGAYAIAVVSGSAPGTVVVAKQDSPLVLGVGDGEMLAASDIPALLASTRDVIFLHDGEVAVLERGGATITTVAGEPVTRAAKRIDWSPTQAEKGGFKHFMLKEIHEQPRAVEDTLRGRVDLLRREVVGEEIGVPALLARKIDRVYFVACGTSSHAAMAGRYWVEQLARLPSTVEIASEVRYREPVFTRERPRRRREPERRDAPTRSPRSRRRRPRARTSSPSPTCSTARSRARRRRRSTPTPGPEIGVASTKCFTTQLAALLLLAVHLGRAAGHAPTRPRRSASSTALMAVPQQMRAVLAKADDIKAIAQKYVHARDMLFLGRGTGFPIALEGALKLKEISYIHAEGYAAGEMKHGPIALIDESMPVVVVCPRDAHYEKTISNMQEVKARDGQLIAVCTEGDLDVERLLTDDGGRRSRGEHGHAPDIIGIPAAEPEVLPLLTVLPLQLLAYYIADLKGTDVDQPRNLAKTVTVE